MFHKYCAECHDGFGAEVSGYPLPLDDLKAMSKYKDGRAIKYLSILKMPAAEATVKLGDEDRKTLIKMLEDAGN